MPTRTKEGKEGLRKSKCCSSKHSTYSYIRTLHTISSVIQIDYLVSLLDVVLISFSILLPAFCLFFWQLGKRTFGKSKEKTAPERIMIK